MCGVFLSFLSLCVVCIQSVSASVVYNTAIKLESYGQSTSDSVRGITDSNLIAGTSDDHAVIWGV